MRARAIIGVGYGDEGKGRTVDWLAAPHGPAALVVRSNGGAQAGHTVLRADGARHVFHHLGSGSFRRARTHLSRFMVSHPMLFADEIWQLDTLGVSPQATADPRGFVTTPWDMMINQAIELARGGARHGSCGLGFGETVERCEPGEHALTVGDLHGGGLRAKLLAIRYEWLPRRLDRLKLANSAALEFAWSDIVFRRYEEQCLAFARRVPLRADAAIGAEAELIFEGAQGLLLDQNAPGFPHLTRSNTGLANVAAIAAEAGIGRIEPVYVTRCYLTRHGRGPMADERPIGRWYAVDDPGNRPNPWQETLRFGLLDPARLGERIAQDLARCAFAANPTLAITCLDQADGVFAWLDDGEVRERPRDRLLEALERATGLPVSASFSSPVNDLAVNKMQNLFSMTG